MKENKILVLITAQESCKRIIDIANEYADRLAADVDVLTVQPVKADAKRRSKDMICLTGLSRKTHRAIRIIYSDQPLRAIISEAEKLEPIHIFVGQGSEKSSFLTGLRLAPINAPISVVGTDGIIYSLPSMMEDILALNPAN